MSIVFILIAGLCVALGNLALRRSVDAGGSSKAFLVVQLLFTFLIAILLNPVRTGEYAWSPCMVAFGAVGGIVLTIMYSCLGKAVELGPSALTFAVMSSSSVMPAIVMTLIFGAAFGYSYTYYHGIGSLLVLIGIIWAGAQTVQSVSKRKWALVALCAFLLHVIFLSFMQWRALFIHFPGENGLFLAFDAEDAINQWFMPALFFVAALIQMLIYAMSQKKWPKRAEVMYGTIGGVLNGVGTFCLMRSTELATDTEHAMIFPLFSVTIILVCNLWGRLLYREQINWPANLLCMSGIVVGTVNWSQL